MKTKQITALLALLLTLGACTNRKLTDIDYSLKQMEAHCRGSDKQWDIECVKSFLTHHPYRTNTVHLKTGATTASIGQLLAGAVLYELPETNRTDFQTWIKTNGAILGQEYHLKQ